MIRKRRRKGQIAQRNNNQYFVASEHGSEAAPQRGRGEQSAQGFGKAALLPIISGFTERNKIKILLRSWCGCAIIGISLKRKEIVMNGTEQLASQFIPVIVGAKGGTGIPREPCRGNS